MKPRLLDLFCGAGGAARGYADAGFYVVGVDIAPQPHYPFEFYEWDALDALRAMLNGDFDAASFDAVHASPPCQGYTTMNQKHPEARAAHPLLIEPVRDLLRATGLPYILENVEGAAKAMHTMVRLHGGMFGLGVHRPRMFESNVLLLAPQASYVTDPVGVYGDKPDGRWLNVRSNGERQYAAASIDEARAAMGMDWGDWHGVKEAIPPAYTRFLGEQLIQHLDLTPSSQKIPNG